MREAVTGVTGGATRRDRLWLALAMAGRPAAFAVNALSSRWLSGPLVNPHWLLVRDVAVRTTDGFFHCGRHTSDYAMVTGAHEPAHRQFFDLADGIFVDVGAHIGRYTVMVARRLGGRGRVIAIEPEERKFALLCENIRANGLGNVVPVRVACTDARPVLLHRHPWLTDFDTLSLDAFPDATRRWFSSAAWVVGRALDSLLEKLGVCKVDLLKIDVEGAELAVLRGATRTLASSPTLRIVLEAWSEEAVRFLEAQGYDLTLIARNRYASDYVAERKGPTSRFESRG